MQGIPDAAESTPCGPIGGAFLLLAAIGVVTVIVLTCGSPRRCWTTGQKQEFERLITRGHV